MRIAFVAHKFPPESLGGVETYSESLAVALAQAGHEVHVFYPLAGIRPSDAQVDRDGMHLWRVPLPTDHLREDPIRQYWHTFRHGMIEEAFAGWVENIQPDVVHFQHVQGVSAKLIEMAAQWPRVLTLHDYWFFCANSQLLRPDGEVCAGPRWGWNCVDCLTMRPDLRWMRSLRPLVAVPLAYRNAYLRRVAESVPVFLAPSEFLRQQYVRQGFPTQRIMPIELGLDVQRLGIGAGPELPAPAGKPHFGFLGTVGPHKGVHVLVEAFNRLPESTALTIYGSEAAFPDYVARVKGMVSHPHIRFAGQLDHRYIGKALRQLDCLVVPSIWYENSPMVIEEAYGFGIPVVASRLGALSEKVQDGATGWLFTAGDSLDLARVLRRLSDHPEQLAAARANVRSPLTMPRHAQRMLEIYRMVIEGQTG